MEARLLDKIRSRIKRATVGGRGKLRHGWRTVERGPLAGLQLYLPASKDALWADRFLVGEYEPEMLAALADLARDGGTLYDIGAHTGFYACAWLRLGGQHVEAFEPAPYNCRVLRATLKKNGMSERANIYELALGNEDKQGTLVISMVDAGTTSSAYLEEPGRVETAPGVHLLLHIEKMNVAVRSLDGVVTHKKIEPPDVIKLDVEGAEKAVLAGAAALLAQHRPTLLCEVHSDEAVLEIEHSLARLGYDLKVLGRNGPHSACLWVHTH